MILSRMTTSAILALSLAGASWAATPDQVGTYTGTIKTTSISASGKTTTKSEMQISIAADDSTTITIGGVEQTIGILYFGPADVFGSFGGTSEIYITSFNFKGTAIKGAATGIAVAVGPPPAVGASTSSKFKLKKQ
jgi:hypothetical protein